MNRFLVILEVSQKQRYIFSSNRLKENAARSEDISWVTSGRFFSEVSPEHYSEDNLVNAGGGHTVLQFSSEAEAKSFVKTVSHAVMEQYPDMELFAKVMQYDEAASPKDNMKRLTELLEKKKARRAASFKQGSYGIERISKGGGGPKDDITYAPKRVNEWKRPERDLHGVQPPEGWAFPAAFELVAGKDNFVAVIHADGNAMGTRVSTVYEKSGNDWDGCRSMLQQFSETIQRDFEDAFSETVAVVAAQCESGNIETSDEGLCRKYGASGRVLPIRPVILAGDDVCFVTAGSIGLECARVFLEKLSAKTNAVDGIPYAACAGVVLVHTKYPFSQAYKLSERLCDEAKKYGKSLDGGSKISAIDWHVEFSQLKDSFSQIREEYITYDDKLLTLRPLEVVTPGVEFADMEDVRKLRNYRFFKNMCVALQTNREHVARGKIKELREALKQGEVESEFYLKNKQIVSLLDIKGDAMNTDWLEVLRAFMHSGEKKTEKKAFAEIDGRKRCLYFDAIEMLDNFTEFKEVSHE